MQRNSPTGSASSQAGSAIGTGSLAWAASRTWRILRTGIGFAQAGILSLLLAVVIFPIIRLLPGTREEKQIRSQRWVHRFVRILLGTAEILQVMRLRCNDIERLKQPGLLVVANHPTLIDALCLMSLMPQADCVVKAGHYHNPFLAGAIKGAGYIPNLDGPRLVSDCVERLMGGRSVIFFPEGTRSPADGLGPFARGAAHVALKSGCDPVPVTIKCEPATLYRGRAWWDVPERIFSLTLTVDEPLIVKDVLQQPMAVPRAARALTAALRDHFERRLVVA
jgi:1-acyl-sn-glycerol-3-phosphate acyltransferase